MRLSRAFPVISSAGFYNNRVDAVVGDFLPLSATASERRRERLRRNGPCGSPVIDRAREQLQQTTYTRWLPALCLQSLQLLRRGNRTSLVECTVETSPGRKRQAICPDTVEMAVNRAGLLRDRWNRFWCAVSCFARFDIGGKINRRRNRKPPHLGWSVRQYNCDWSVQS